jgi:translocation and assembly module TamB
LNLRRVLVWFVGTTLVAVVLASLALFLLFRFLATDAGSEWAVTKTANASSLQINWQQMSGNLVEGLELTGLGISLPGMDIRAQRVVASWDIFGLAKGELFISNLEVVELSLTVVEQVDPDVDLRLIGSWPAFESPVAISLERSEILGITYQSPEQNFRIDKVEFAGRIGSSDFEIRTFVVEQQNNQVQLSGDLQMWPPYPMSLSADWVVSTDSQQRFEGQADIQGSLEQIDIEHRLLLPVELFTSGEILSNYDPAIAGIDLTQVSFDLSNSWQLQNINLPQLTQQPDSSGQLAVRGRLDDYLLDGQFDIGLTEFPDLSPQSVELLANVRGQEVVLEQLEVEGAIGRLNGSGALSWSEQLVWNLELQLGDINPGVLWSDWPGEINAELTQSGTLNQDQLTVDVLINSFEGAIRNYPVSASGGIGYADGRLNADNLIFRQGSNQLLLSADLQDSLTAQWQIQAPNLFELYPDLSGSLVSNGSITGSLLQPVVSATVEAESLNFQNISINSLRAEIENSTEDLLDGSAQIGQLVYAGQVPVDMAIVLFGSTASHEYQLQLLQGEVALSLSGNGSLLDASWSSAISAVDLTVEFLGQWTLGEPASLRVSKEDVQIDRLCLFSQGSDICTDLQYSRASGIGLQTQINSLQIATFKHYLPEQAEFEGALRGDLNLSGSIGDLQGTVGLQAVEVAMTLQSSEGPETYVFRESSVQGRYSSSLLNLSLNSRLAGSGTLSGNIELPILDGNAALSGSVEAHFNELAWVDPFFPSLSEIAGETDISLRLSGSTSAPELTGDLYLRDLSAYVPELGIVLTDSQLSLVNSGRNSWNVQGLLASGEGSVALEGMLGFRTVSDWNAQLNISGEQFLAYSKSVNQLVVNPMLDFEVSPESINVGGQMEIPAAEVEIRSLATNAAQVSADEMIVGERRIEQETRRSIPIFADISLILGDDIFFRGFSIEGKLGGRLRLRENPNQPLRADGNIQIVDGVYSTYGQELTIDPGELIFAGPVDNPSFNVRAFRRVEDTLVGVQIGGTAKQLSSSLYSSPVLSSTETLALLITGRPLANANATDGELLVNAVTALGINQSAVITQRLQGSLGLDVLAINADNDLVESSITIGKYLSPRIFISYAKDILTPNANFSLDYSLSDNLRINAKSGTNQSMDVFYRIQH